MFQAKLCRNLEGRTDASLLERENKAEEQRKAIANERAKLTASYVNTIAGSVFGIGGLAPIVAVLYAPASPVVPMWAVAGISILRFAASVSLHVAARRYLRELL